jgi:hypothetical protein
MNAVTTDRKYFTPWRNNTTAAVESRVRRALACQGEMLHKVRPESCDYYGYGPYYVVDERNCVVSAQHDLEQLARELRVLHEGEVIAE